MSAIDRITYRARLGVAGIVILQASTTLRDRSAAESWQRRLEPWLRSGDSRGRAYLDLGPNAALVRWQSRAGSRLAWEYAQVLLGPSAELTGAYALELDELTPTEGSAPVPWTSEPPGPRRDALAERARSAAVTGELVPLLGHALAGSRRVTMPWTESGQSDAVLWAMLTLLRMTGDSRPVSFLTCAPAQIPVSDVAGLLVSLRDQAAVPLPPDPGFAALAADLVHRYTDDPAALRRELTESGVRQAADHSGRISALLSLPPRRQPGTVYRGGAATVSATFDNHVPRTTPPVPSVPVTPVVVCPICLGEIPDWDALDYYRYGSDGDWHAIAEEPGATVHQRARARHGAYVRCPASASSTIHHLPARYGQFGDPVLLGFVGLTESGKSHLLTAMIGAIGKLSDYRIDVEPLDPAMHHRFLENSVKPLVTRNEALPGTPDDATTQITDAFIVRHGSGSERVVALFDVSGGVLAQTEETREFLWIADGLFFVIDPDHIRASKVGDDTFSNVLNVVRGRAKSEPVNAAIVLAKADKVRFTEPVARWLRSGNGTLDPTEFLRESADVYAYLVDREAEVLTEPYRVCQKATLHVASSTGGAKEGEDRGSKYPRGVTPMRVLRPLVAMLAMTGVLTGPEAERIGA